MTRHVALLRGINVGGRAPVSMSTLRDVAAGLGLGDVATLLQSGNLVFGCTGRKAAELERVLEAATEKQFGHRPDYVVRTAKEWTSLIARNPFGDAAKNDPAHLLVMCFKTAPTRAGVEALRAAIKGPELVETDGREVYLVYPSGVGRSRVTGALIERLLGARGTARNWNTTLKIELLLH